MSTSTGEQLLAIRRRVARLKAQSETLAQHVRSTRDDNRKLAAA